jgi:hypothetical protein
MDILSNSYISTHFESHGTNANAAMLEAYEFGVAKTIFEKLWAHYAGYDWKVKVNAIGGIATIQLPRLHHSTIAYILKLDDLASDPGLRGVVKAGGELLERWNLRRGQVNRAQYRDAIRARPVVMRRDMHIDGGLAVNHRPAFTHGQHTPILRAA